MKNLLLITAAIGALSACKADLDVTVYTSDLAKVLAGNLDVATPALLGVEMINCPQHGPDLAPALAAGFASVEFIGCADRGLDTFAEYRVQIGITPAADKPSPANALGIELFFHRDEPHRVAGLFINPAKLDAIETAVPARIRNAASGDLAPRVVITLHNDLPANWTGAVRGAFLDGQPFQTLEEFTLATRSEARITLSDVGNAGLRGGAVLFMLPE